IASRAPGASPSDVAHLRVAASSHRPPLSGDRTSLSDRRTDGAPPGARGSAVLGYRPMFVCPECGLAQGAGGGGPADGTALVPSDDPIVGAVIGAYRVARLLGVGGMGRVYKAVHPQIGSRVAIKVLSRECADRPDLVERFFSEARAVNLIRHESIVN